MSLTQTEQLIADWERVAHFAASSFGTPVSFGSGLVLTLTGQAVHTPEGVLIRGADLRLQDGQFLGVEKALVRLSHADWALLGPSCLRIRVLFASGFAGLRDERILDCTGPQTILVAHASIQEGTSVSVADA